jgi:hypothetical protein
VKCRGSGEADQSRSSRCASAGRTRGLRSARGRGASSRSARSRHSATPSLRGSTRTGSTPGSPGLSTASRRTVCSPTTRTGPSAGRWRPAGAPRRKLPPRLRLLQGTPRGQHLRRGDPLHAALPRLQLRQRCGEGFGSCAPVQREWTLPHGEFRNPTFRIPTWTSGVE